MLFSFLSLMAGLQSPAMAQTSLPTFETASNVGAENAQVSRFRVLVFPHWGAYSTPQGKEPTANSVTVQSTAECEVYLAKLDTNQEWLKVGEALERKSEFILNAKKIKKFSTPNYYYSCSEPFTIKRATPLKSFSYRGDFVVVTNSNSIQIINIVDSDTYIKGVVPSEVDASWPAETLKAQAVAARTYAWWSVINARKKIANYDMDDTVSSQAYLGASKQSPSTDAATDQTAGLVLKYNGFVIKSYFSADSGGFAEDSKSVFGDSLSYCQARAEQYDLSLTKTDWTKTFTTHALRDLLVRAKLLPAGSVISNVSTDAKQRTASGRAGTLSVRTTTGRIYSIQAPAFRYATQVRSTLFEVKTTGSNVLFTGKGYGHGVGMAQIGALEYARQLNWTFDQILLFYYNGANLTNE